MTNREIGNYRILEYVGSGGFGSVFRAEDTKTAGRIVAIKELHKKHTRSTAIKQRFFQEAVAMARLDHPNLPRLYTFGEDSGCYYLVMEFVAGGLLGEEIERSGAIAEPRARAVISQVLQAVSYAHRNGIIHRDLKPDNIMIVEEGDRMTVKVLDFGIARLIGGENLTMTGEGFGTPSYMSPERIAAGQDIDQRTDIYSLGIILFEMLTGKAPFESKATDPAIFWAEIRRLHETAPLPSLAPYGVSEELERIVRKAAAKRSDDRYSTADEMLADLAGGQPTARLLVSTEPSGASIFVDNLPRGTSDPSTGRLTIGSLTPGVHSVRVEMPGYNSYRIDVMLQGGDETALQASLAARATVAMTPAGVTSPSQASSGTVADSDGARTVLYTVEQLPPGSSLFIGAREIGQADENGRATVALEPGVHNIDVTSRSGARRTGLVTVAGSDVGTTREITLPLRSGTVEAGAVQTTRPRLTGRRNYLPAAAATAVLAALAATAYFVIKGPAPTSQSSNQTAQLQVDGNSNSQGNRIATVLNRSENSNTNNAAASQNANHASAPKKNANLNSSVAAGFDAGNSNRAETAKTETTIDRPGPAPVVPTPTPPVDQTAGDACVNVIVLGPGDRPAGGARVGAIEQVSGGGTLFRHSRTGPRGRTAICGLVAGGRARVGVLSPGGSLVGGTEVMVGPGRTPVVLRVGYEGLDEPRVRQSDPEIRLPGRQRRKNPFRRPGN